MAQILKANGELTWHRALSNASLARQNEDDVLYTVDAHPDATENKRIVSLGW